jgi:vancomycin resistance protein YoaR
MNNISKKWMKWIPLFTLAALCIGFAGGGAATKAETAENHKIADGVYIGNVYVGGMTEEEAVDAISAYAQSVDDAVLTLNANGKSVEVSAQELGITFQNTNAVQEALAVGRNGNLIKRYKDKKDLEHGSKVFELPLGLNETAAREVLTAKAEKLNNEAVDNGLIRENGQFQFIEGSSGVEVNVEKSLMTIEDYLKNNWDGTDASIDLVAEVVEPEGTKEELAKVKDLLGSYTTNYSTSSAGRCANISVAAGKINGTVLYPGEEFSVGQTIGPLTAAGGYELAGAYENGQTVQSYGGGVCQVSTTLYNAVLKAELEVTQRSNHSMIVTYVKPSMDAAIAGDYKDLVFENDTDAPIYVQGIYNSGGSITFNIYGHDTRKAGHSVKYESKTIKTTPVKTQTKKDSSKPVGYSEVESSGHVGYVAELWKITYEDGKQVSKELIHTSTYAMSPTIVVKGTKKASTTTKKDDSDKDNKKSSEETTKKSTSSKKSKKSE